MSLAFAPFHTLILCISHADDQLAPAPHGSQQTLVDPRTTLLVRHVHTLLGFRHKIRKLGHSRKSPFPLTPGSIHIVFRAQLLTFSLYFTNPVLVARAGQGTTARTETWSNNVTQLPPQSYTLSFPKALKLSPSARPPSLPQQTASKSWKMGLREAMSSGGGQCEDGCKERASEKEVRRLAPRVVSEGQGP